MSNFDNNNEKPNTLKDIRFINILNKNTSDKNLIWKKSVNEDKDFYLFTSSHAITERKKLSFGVKFSFVSDKKEDNVLRVLLRMETIEKNGTFKSSSSVIKKIYLEDYPTLTILIRNISSLYLGKNYISPLIKTSSDLKHKTIVANDIEEYRKIILKEVKDIMRKLPNFSNDYEWEKKYINVFTAYDGIKKSETIEEINDLFYQASKAIEENPPKDNSRYARI